MNLFLRGYVLGVLFGPFFWFGCFIMAANIRDYVYLPIKERRRMP